MPCAQEGHENPRQVFGGVWGSKRKKKCVLTSQGSWGNKLHKEGHKQKCKGAHESLAGADGAQKKVSGSRLH